MQLIYQSHYTDQVAVVSTADLAETFDRKVMFFAANRVDDCAAQQDMLDWMWAKNLRSLIDVIEMPSMSVGDRYLLLSESGTVVSSGLVETVGWRDLEPDEMVPLLDRAGAL